MNAVDKIKKACNGDAPCEHCHGRGGHWHCDACWPAPVEREPTTKNPALPAGCAGRDYPKWKWRIEIPDRHETWHLEAREKGELAKILNGYIDQPCRVIITTLR